MATKTFTFTEEEVRQLSIWANNARHDRDQDRLMARIGSPAEKAAEADMLFIEGIMDKLAARVPVTPFR